MPTVKTFCRYCHAYCPMDVEVEEVLDGMAVTAEELNIVDLTTRDRLEPRQAILGGAFGRSASVDVVECQGDLVVEAADGAATAKHCDGFLSGRAVATSAAVTRQFTDAVGVVRLPLSDGGLLPLVVARAADAASLDRRAFMAVDTTISHVGNPTRGRRTPVEV